MVARNEVLEQLGLQVKEEEFLSKLAAIEQAESYWRSPPPCSSGYPSRSPTSRPLPESRPSLRRKIGATPRQRDEDRRRLAKESPRLVAQIRAERAEELARASKRSARAISAGALRRKKGK